MVESSDIEDRFHQKSLWDFIKTLDLEYDFHKIAQMFPLLEQNELNKLAEDIKTNGLLQPIILFEGKILDGRNRYLACNQVNIEPKFIIGTFKSQEEAEDYVISENLHRRHLNKDQLAIISVEILMPLYEERARIRQLGQLRPFEGKSIDIKDNKIIIEGEKTDLTVCHGNMTNSTNGRATSELAKKAKIGTNKIQKAKRIIDVAKSDPAIKKKLNEIKNGKTTINNVYSQIQKKENKDKPLTPLPENKYNVIYADPPWFYETGTTPNRIIENQYPTMETGAICSLKVPSANDSILFLWVTSPKLEDGLEVIKAWGFIYKTNMVWVKDKIGMGYYARGQHELLLIATKGTPGTPDPSNRPSSVIEAPRTKHSKKPDIVYNLIEQMYPNGKYLELFARNERDKWTSWGNEIEN